jgi:hypothetical protein
VVGPLALVGPWKQHLPTYQERRAYVIRLYEPLLDALDDLERRQLTGGLDLGETGWSKVDSRVHQLHGRFASASTVEDYKGIGYACRDLIITVANAVFDSDRHVRPDEGPLKGDDAKNRIDRALEVEFSGESHQKLRKYVRSLWEYVSTVAHSESTTEQTATVAVHGTLHLIDTLLLLFPPEPEPEPEVIDWGVNDGGWTGKGLF